jgi:hypothetical protein
VDGFASLGAAVDLAVTRLDLAETLGSDDPRFGSLVNDAAETLERVGAAAEQSQARARRGQAQRRGPADA